MTRNDLTAELSRLEAATPSRFASFNEDRARRIAAIRAQLATMPEETPAEDPSLRAFLDRQAKAERAQRATERRGY